MRNFHILLLTLSLILTTISGCEEEQPKPVAPAASLPHLRYFASTATEDAKELFTLYDYDISAEDLEEIWAIEDENIDRVELTPDGDYALVHYSNLEELSQYYVIYDLNSPSPAEPMTFYRGEKESGKVSAFEAYLDFAVYKYSFIIGDVDFKTLKEGGEGDVYKFAWVNLPARIVEEIPLTTSMDRIPDITFVPVEGGYFDFIQKDQGDILRFHWNSAETGFIHKLYDKEKEPLRNITHIGSFKYFAEFEQPRGTKSGNEPVSVGLRTQDEYIVLKPGDFPLSSLWDEYIFIRVFPPDILNAMTSGGNPQEIMMKMAMDGVPATFAIYDIEKTERRDIALEMGNPVSLPHPAYDPASDLIAVSDLRWIPFDEAMVSEDDDVVEETRSIIIFDIPNNKVIATIEDIPDADDTTMAFHRPEQ